MNPEEQTNRNSTAERSAGPVAKPGATCQEEGLSQEVRRWLVARLAERAVAIFRGDDLG